MMRLRIGFLVYDFASRHSGGIATYVHTIGKYLVSDGHYVEIFTSRGQADCESPYKVTELSEAHERLGRLELSRRFADAIQSRRDEFDVVEASDWGMEGYFCLKHAIAPCIIRFHTPNSVVEDLNACSFRMDSSSVNSTEAEYFGMASFLSAPSQAMIALIQRLFSINKAICCLPNPVEVDCLEAAALETQTGVNTSSLIGFLGRLERRKGVYELADALKTFLQDNPGLQFHFAGPDTRNKLGSVGKDLLAILRPVQGQVKLRGYLDRVDRNLFLSSLRFCVLPSLWENAPYACIEAMALGVNLVVTSGSGFEEMVGNDRKVVFADPGNSSSLLAAMRLQRLAEPARSRYSAIDKFSWRALREPTLRFYEQVVARGVSN